MGAIYLFFKGPFIAKATTRQAGRTDGGSAHCWRRARVCGEFLHSGGMEMDGKYLVDKE
jgi:hypothetical protein